MTFDEYGRREVARRLRGIKDTREECGHDMCCDLWSAIFGSDYRCTGLCDECEVAVLDSLADLIEPAPKCSEATPKCDRDALLALADKMASFSWDSSCPSCAASGQPECSCGVECRESISHSAARRIREACGEAR